MKKIWILLLLCLLCFCGCANNDNGEGYAKREEADNLKEENEKKETQANIISENQNNDNVDVTDSESSIEDDVQSLTEESSENKQVWIADFLYEYDNNNKITISIYKDGEHKFSLVGQGIYEEVNMSLLQYERQYGLYHYFDLWGNEGQNIDLLFTVGDERYFLIYSNGELISDTVPLDGYDGNGTSNAGTEFRKFWDNKLLTLD